MQPAQHLEDAGDLPPGRALGPALRGALEERAQIAVTRVLEREAVQQAWPRANANERKCVVHADRLRLLLEHLAEVRLAQPAVDARADLQAQ